MNTGLSTGLPAALGVLAALLLLSPSLALAQEKPPLALEEALSRALEHAPVLGAFSARASAAKAGSLQAGVLPNPEISIEAENIYGDKPYDGFKGAEITYGVSQRVELPGKRGNRLRAAQAESASMGHARDAARLDLVRDVTVAFAEVVSAQEDVSLQEEEQTLAQAVRDSVVAKVEAGKEPPIRQSKAEIESAASRLSLDRARRHLEARREVLFSLMGGAAGAGSNWRDQAVAAGSLPPLSPPLGLADYAARLGDTPETKMLATSAVAAEVALSLENAAAIPDPTFTLGVKDARGEGVQSFVAGVSFPFPVFDRNRAAILRAGHDLTAARFDQQSAQLSAGAALARVHGDLATAYGQAAALQKEVLPGATEAFSIAREGYDAGKFGYLEVLDAQRTLFDARRQMNQAVLDYHRQKAEIERITAVQAQQYNDKEAIHENVQN